MKTRKQAGLDNFSNTPITDRGEATRERILIAAQRWFATVGFEGTSLRKVSAAADVQHTLLLYHFKTKDALWRAVMERLFRQVFGDLRAALEGTEGLEPRQTVRRFIRGLVIFFAAHPDLPRIMILEGQQNTERLTWLVDNFTRPAFQKLVSIVRSAQPDSATYAREDDIYIFYALIGLTTTPFTHANEFKLLSGQDIFDAAEIDRAADFITRLLLNRLIS